jgi:hypothetical protein
MNSFSETSTGLTIDVDVPMNSLNTVPTVADVTVTYQG